MLINIYIWKNSEDILYLYKEAMFYFVKEGVLKLSDGNYEPSAYKQIPVHMLLKILKRRIRGRDNLLLVKFYLESI